MIVVDASAVVELVLRMDRWQGVADLVLGQGARPHAPCFLEVEVLHALRRLERLGAIDAPRAQLGLENLRDLYWIRYPLQPLVDRVWGLRHNLTSYDAFYVALAEALGVPLVTTDARLGRAPGHSATIRVV